MGETEILPCQLSGEGMRVGVRGHAAGRLVTHMRDVNRRLQVRIGLQEAGVRACLPAQRFLDNGYRLVRIPTQPPAVRILVAAESEFTDRKVRGNALGKGQT